jgi:hypothetical protein
MARAERARLPAGSTVTGGGAGGRWSSAGSVTAGAAERRARDAATFSVDADPRVTAHQDVPQAATPTKPIPIKNSHGYASRRGRPDGLRRGNDTADPVAESPDGSDAGVRAELCPKHPERSRVETGAWLGLVARDKPSRASSRSRAAADGIRAAGSRASAR